MENIILDHNFNLKIIDFGLSCVLKEKQSDEMVQKCGTKGYQAPEMLASGKYRGSEFDIFSSTIILFMMLIQSEPFVNASPQDLNYKAMLSNRWESYWNAFIGGEDIQISSQYKELVQTQFKQHPKDRYNMS
jgi:serine/threonine protein kinase